MTKTSRTEFLPNLERYRSPKTPMDLGFLFARSVLKEVRPGDRIGVLLVVQMLVLHDATMTQSGQLAVSEDLPQTASFANMVNKFARTFTRQMETLHRWRSAPEQKVTVNNVSVSGGGQGIVGHVTHTGGSGTNDVANPPPTLTDQSGTAMPIIQPDEQSATTVPRIEQDQEPAPSATRRRRSK